VTTILTVIAIWAVISVPFGMAVGRFIRAGTGTTTRKDQK
jgi:hypothetical protein